MGRLPLTRRSRGSQRHRLAKHIAVSAAMLAAEEVIQTLGKSFFTHPVSD
jgi:hypothetical protein